jgi:hypothetical protein
LSSFTENYKVFPVVVGEGLWELQIDTGMTLGPLGPRFNFGGGCPQFIWEFDNKESALKASDEWNHYFKENAKKKKATQKGR